MLITGFVCIEMQRDIWMLDDVFDFVRIRFAKDQNRIIFPDKPNRTWLRSQIGINRRQPDHVLILKMSLYNLTKSCR
jgi:hypothetical protein